MTLVVLHSEGRIFELNFWQYLLMASHFEQFGFHSSLVPESVEESAKWTASSSSYLTHVRWDLNPINEMDMA